MSDEKHPATDHPAFVKDGQVMNRNELADVFLPAEFFIEEFHPLPNGEGRPTEVHIVVKPPEALTEALRPVLEGDCMFVVRLKSKAACQAMIDVLHDHMQSVWSDT